MDIGATDTQQLIQSVVTLAGIAAGVAGVLGKRRVRDVLSVMIRAIEDSQATDVKRRVRKRSLIVGNDKRVDREVERATGTRIKRIHLRPPTHG